MKKVLIFILLLAAVIGIYFFNAKKNADKIVESAKEGSKIRDGQLAISRFELVYSEHYYETYNMAIGVEDLVSRYNNEVKESDNYSFATLNSNNTITINNEHFDYSYDCSIVTENCKYKIVCFEEESSEFELGDC